jgi:hypothetical protein
MVGLNLKVFKERAYERKKINTTMLFNPSAIRFTGPLQGFC